MQQVSSRQMEKMVNKIGQPSKEQIREWLTYRQANHEPPPDMEQIRRELGWNLIQRIDGISQSARIPFQNWIGSGDQQITA
jgi:hypothetical protein